MDIRELKELLRNSTSVLILDNGEPSFVIVDYAVYRKMTGAQKEQAEPVADRQEIPVSAAAEPARGQLSAQEVEALERLNKEIQALKDQIEQEERQGSFRE